MKSAITYLDEWAVEPWKKNIIDIVVNDKGDEISEIFDEIIQIIKTKSYIYEQNEEIPENTNFNKIIIKKISSPTNINALAEDVFFELGERLNVFYGENGSGKSSYVRIFRKLAENYYTSKKNLNILPNVYKKIFSSYEEQLLDVTYKIADTQLIETIDINKIHPTLSKINVFDSDSVYPLIDNELAFKVLPKGFEYFEKAAQLIDKLKSELKGRIGNLNQEKEDIFNSIIYDKVKEELEIIFNSLHSSSQVKHYLSFNYSFSIDDVQKKISIETQIKELESANPESKIKLLVLQKSKLQAIIENLKEFAKSLTLEKIKNINSIITEYEKKLDVERMLNQAYKSNISYLSIVNDEWLAFINKGVDYLNSINQENIFRVKHVFFVVIL